MDNYFSNTSFVNLMLKWRKHLAVITIIGAVAGIIFSGSTFITPLYKSEAIAYPANINSYSDESQTEQMLQILQSQDIVDSMIQKFNLAAHYKIDPAYRYYQTALLTEYHQNVKISKTPYEAISIAVKDKDSQQAAEMAMEILRLYDRKIASLHKGKSLEVIHMYELQLATKKRLIDSLQSRLYVLGNEYGLIDYTAQSQEIMKGYLRTVYGNNGANINTKGVMELKANIEKHGGELLTLLEMIQQEARTFVETKTELEQAQRFYNANLTYSNIISKPFPSDKKAYPVRWIVVSFSAIGAFLLALLAIFVIDARNPDAQKKN
ncbi:MAG: hypothetical protein H3C41_10635 [Bacteroidales bacterium]|nr:hypothetical protein [Bacteroidales bacterium]